ncbi:probable cytochrome P450 313a4 [Wyeomyia smithii]|uniref:probable cytochrome P450 313a4 n=1 Tax=Wyeomyia smithii TaxID=174621 RepID=UPI0024681726|nr:probable cytochrome P450 313a4 [Wyeomyia smithii]
MIVEILVLVLLALCLRYYIKFRQRMSFAKDMPTAQPCYPLVGNLLSFLWKNDEEMFDNVQHIMKNPAKLFKAWMGPISFIGTSDPDSIRGILTHPHCIQKPYIYDFFKIDFGLFAAPSNIWKVQRKALNPSFNHKILYRFFPIFDRYARKLVERLLQIPEDCEVQITKFTTRCTVAMVCATTIGSDIDEDRDTEKFACNMNGILELVAKRCLNLFTCLESIYKLTEAFRVEKSMRQDAWEFVDKVTCTIFVKNVKKCCRILAGFS